MKPLGYYTDHTPGDGGLLDTLETRFGSNFEKMTRREKFFLISNIAITLCVKSPGVTRDEVMSAGLRLQGASLSTKLGLLKFLLDNNESEFGLTEPALPQSDPSWEYHQILTALHSINSATIEAIRLISGVEVASSATDEALLQLLQPELERLEGIVSAIPQ